MVTDEAAAHVSDVVSRFVTEAESAALPEEVRHQARRSLLNFMAVAVAGQGDPAVEAALRTMAPFGGPPQASLIGRPERADPLTAAWLNAMSANVHDFDDTHMRTVIHPTAPVAPPLLALCEMRRVRGRDLVAALALGMEVACRIGNAVSPGHYARGWHITATCGVFGAAVAAGRLLGLDSAQMRDALGGASAQSSGLVETLGFMAKSLGVGNAARNGLLAALLAREGFGGPARPLEGERGFLKVMGEEADPTEIAGGLGTRWEVLKNIHKPYPCGIVLNAVIDACLELRGRPGVVPEELARIELHGNPLLRQRTDRPEPAGGREAQVSAQHAVAASLLTGAAGLEQFSDAAVRDGRIQALRGRVFVVEDPEVPVPSVRLVAERRDGTRETVVVEHARGTEARPLSDAELEDKLRTLAAAAGPGRGCDAGRLIERVWSLEALEDSSELLAAARP
jgi:2-methylcitrate dehydratase PrpD